MWSVHKFECLFGGGERGEASACTHWYAHAHNMLIYACTVWVCVCVWTYTRMHASQSNSSVVKITEFEALVTCWLFSAFLHGCSSFTLILSVGDRNWTSSTCDIRNSWRTCGIPGTVQCSLDSIPSPTWWTSKLDSWMCTCTARAAAGNRIDTRREGEEVRGTSGSTRR